MGKKIGFVGLGTMGLPMAVNLNKAGFEVIGYDAFAGSREKAKAAGIKVAATLKEVAEQADDAIVSMVRDYAQNVEVLLGDGGLLSVKPKGMTIIVMSTLDPDSMNELGQKVEAAADVNLIAAAVSGGATGAPAGTLSIMASGPHDRVVAARPYFDAVASNTFYYGRQAGQQPGREAGQQSGPGRHHEWRRRRVEVRCALQPSPDELLNLFKASTGDSWVARNWNSVSKWTEDTALAVLLKDLKAAHIKGLENGITMPFNALSSTMLFDSWGQKPKVK